MNTDRSKHRMERLREIELEQQQWEQDALVMPEAWDQLLLLSFRSVKTEFSDLDGLSWSTRCCNPDTTHTPWVHEAPTPKATCSDLGQSTVSPDTAYWPPRLPPPPAPTHTVYPPRSELGSFAPDNTIRASRLPPSRPPLYPANQLYDLSHRVARLGTCQSQDCSHQNPNTSMRRQSFEHLPASFRTH
ncbi:hypothetical protein SCLCIDRAFT_1214433 [Scleroderma citrinum Foug A]|uniref:Uncharacterized protein n=1 Tax=Scleroderma citrinum Foug A TaxID=1036808 RepID=A0A0C3DR68_9AGAM|nr:hypothetical protein SCLCIDRAFT_1214433 [Scleroderma citrinum Foug A]